MQIVDSKNILAGAILTVACGMIAAPCRAEMPSVLGLQPGMSLAETETVLHAIQPPLEEQYVIAKNPISNGTPTKEFIDAGSMDATGQKTIWLRFSLLTGDLETINYQESFGFSNAPSQEAVTRSLVAKYGPYSMQQIKTLVWQYDHAGNLLPGGNAAIASSPENPNCTANNSMAERGNVDNELSRVGLQTLAAMYSACDIVYQFMPQSNDGISIAYFSEDLISYKALHDEADALIPALQNSSKVQAQEEQEQAIKNKPSL